MTAVTVSDPALLALAYQHLPPAVAERWVALLRSGLRLRSAGAHELGAGQLGGLPALPGDVAWPLCEGHGPLGFIAAIDCDNLPRDPVDIALPASGTLLFFYFSEEDTAGRMGNRPAEHSRALIESLKAKGLNVFEPEYWATHPHVQAQVLHVPSGVPTVERHAPGGITPYARVRLAAEPIVTGPDWEHPAFRAAVRDLSDEDRAFINNPFNSDPFRLAMSGLVARPDHRIGGYANPVQGSVEVDVAHGMLGGRVEYSDPALQMLAQQWTVLAQIDTDGDAEMMWGDCGSLYWLIRPDDLVVRV